jgi:tripartite-type tricarboxylate transporter receptor subunit TctC
MFWNVTVLTVGLIFLMSPMGQAKDDTFPTREINMYIGAPPGGSLDTSGRVISDEMTKMLGKPVVVVNKPGGGQSIGVSFVGNSKPDGYVIGYLLNPYLITKKLTEPDLPYDVDTLTWLGSTYKFNFMLTVKADSPWRTYEDLTKAWKKDPRSIKFGSDGAGGAQHILQLLFAQKMGIKDMVHVPFAGGGPAVRALLGGHVDAVTISPGPTGPYVKSGDLRWLAYFSPKRNTVYPDVPAVKELGMELYGGGWTAFFGSKGLPNDVKTAMVKTVKDSAKAEKVKAIFHKMGWEYEYHTPDECVEMWKADEANFKPVLKQLGLIK